MSKWDMPSITPESTQGKKEQVRKLSMFKIFSPTTVANVSAALALFTALSIVAPNDAVAKNGSERAKVVDTNNGKNKETVFFNTSKPTIESNMNFNVGTKNIPERLINKDVEINNNEVREPVSTTSMNNQDTQTGIDNPDAFFNEDANGNIQKKLKGKKK